MNPDVVDLLVTSGYLLDEVIELVKCMGVVFNPKFYLSLDDFRMENAAGVFEGIGDLFGTTAAEVFSGTGYGVSDGTRSFIRKLR